MKKLFKLAFSLSLTVALVMALSLTAFAGTVTFNESAKDFVFEPGSEYSPTDLFDDFKNVMPGDVITDTVEIKNNIRAGNAADLWFKANGAREMPEGVNDIDFLSQLKLKVSKEDGTVVAEVPLDTTDWVHLGYFENSESTKLNLELTVPAELEVTRPEGMSDDDYNALYDKVQNSFADTAGYIEWEFKADIYETSTTTPPVDTGDISNTMLYLVVMAACAAMLIFLVFLKKRKTEE